MFVPIDADGVDGAIALQLPVQLSPAVVRRLATWCRQTAQQLDVTALARGEVIETLIEQLLTDPHISDSVRGRLADRLGTT
jgi:hypothetical protein